MFDVVVFVVLAIPIVMFGLIFSGFLIAGIMDLVIAKRNKRDLFYQLSKDHNVRVRPARK